ncbi:DNA excision repair protein ERCC-6-like [Porphyridium purpureum]|uniref:DNA excision repair protein ERCC-6-like n=1 Tax=Porphyridium purpureum TaxID=35688 RepID=A0A5J4Z0H3_PORPP|nr:DNA excision repair protein ERCC-6-like [Porphyridium purpureum]|eukprot:POR2515..scf208_2
MDSVPYVFQTVRFDDDHGDEEDPDALAEALKHDARAKEWKFLPLINGNDYRLDGTLTMPSEWYSRLTHFQRMGIAWMYHQTVKKTGLTGAILADKTSAADKRLQLLALFECLVYSGHANLSRALIVVDGYHAIASYLELIRSGLCTLLPVRVLHGKKAHCERVLKELSHIQACGIVLTTYEVLTAHLERCSGGGSSLTSRDWDFVVMDHVHTKILQSGSLTRVAQISSTRRVILCDVPFRPEVFSDIYHVTQYVSRDRVFGSKQEFLKQYIVLDRTSSSNVSVRMEPLLERLRPFILRREQGPDTVRQASLDDDDDVEVHDTDGDDGVEVHDTNDAVSDDESMLSDASSGFRTAEGECMISDNEVAPEELSPQSLSIRPLTYTILKARSKTHRRLVMVDSSSDSSESDSECERDELRKPALDVLERTMKDTRVELRDQILRPSRRPGRRIVIESSDSEDDLCFQMQRTFAASEIESPSRKQKGLNTGHEVSRKFGNRRVDQENVACQFENMQSKDFAAESSERVGLDDPDKRRTYLLRVRAADTLRGAKRRPERERALRMYLEALELSARDPVLHIRAATLSYELFGAL